MLRIRRARFEGQDLVLEEFVLESAARSREVSQSVETKRNPLKTSSIGPQSDHEVCADGSWVCEGLAPGCLDGRRRLVRGMGQPMRRGSAQLSERKASVSVSPGKSVRMVPGG